MKRPRSSIRLALPAALVLILGSHPRAADSSEDPESSWDLHGFVEIGGATVPDLDGQLGYVAGTNAYSEELTLKWEPGLAVFGGFREDVRPWLAAEVQSGLLFHSIDQVDTGSGLPLNLDTELFQIPITFNLVLQLPGDHALTPYAGAGAGATVNWLDINARLPVAEGTPLQINESSTEVTFAWHAFAGLRLRAGSSGQISLAYHLFGGGSPTWGLESTVAISTNATANVNVGTLKANDILTHAITLGFHVGM